MNILNLTQRYEYQIKEKNKDIRDLTAFCKLYKLRLLAIFGETEIFVHFNLLL